MGWKERESGWDNTAVKGGVLVKVFVSAAIFSLAPLAARNLGYLDHTDSPPSDAHCPPYAQSK